MTAETSDSWITNIDYSAAGTVSFEVAANNGDAREGTITLKYTGASDVDVTISQAAKPSYDITLGNVTDGKVYVGSEINNTVNFTITSSYNWTVSNTFAISSSYDYPASGDAGENSSIQIKALVQNTSEDARKLGTLSISNGGASSTTVEVWQNGTTVNPPATSTAYLTGTNMSDMTDAGTGYNTTKSITLGSFTWESNGYQDGQNSLTNMLQLRVRTNSKGVSWVKLPTFPGNIQSITMDVTGNSNTDTSLSDGANPSATIAVQAGTTKDETPIVSGTATNKSITLDLSSESCTTGYIVSTNGGFRIWSITVVYNNN